MDEWINWWKEIYIDENVIASFIFICRKFRENEHMRTDLCRVNLLFYLQYFFSIYHS